MNELTEKLAFDKTTLNSALARVIELNQRLKYNSKEDLISEIISHETEKQVLEDTLRQTEVALHESDKAIAAYSATIGEAKRRLADKIEIDINAEIANQEKFKERREVLGSNSKLIAARLSANRVTLENVKLKMRTAEALEKMWKWLKALSDTANGTVSGREKIMLETYVQMSCFDRVIRRANLRFMVMSGGQYEMKRRREADNNRSQSGLELDVIDHYNGSERSVRTLSGGESFMASLSLALGLSDEIQYSAGGIRLDTMFVDEGFGSLDEESLSQAMNALIGLTEGNRLVGIISHVEELKEKIERKIVVTKTAGQGSSAKIIL